jgi:hypothetical protein
VALGLSALLLNLSCGGKSKAPPTDNGNKAQPGGDEVLIMTGDAPPGLAIRLSDGKESGGKLVQVKQAKATKLSDADAQRLLQRMKALKAEADDRKNFALRDKSKPPPRTGKTVKGQFPPAPVDLSAPTTTNDDGKALEVLRFAPEGDVPLVPNLSITFSQPMVAVTSHDDTVKDIPVTLSPKPAGKWRWIGTKTLLFDPEVRFPQATKYTVTIPKGTKSAIGNELAEELKFDFTTPAPRVVSSWPNWGPQKLDPVMYVAFDQRIDAQKVLDTIKVKAGSKSYNVRAATKKEIAEDLTVKNMIDSAESQSWKDRYVAFRVDALLPKDTTIEVRIGPKTPSAEGPLKTTSAQSFSFQTYPPLRLIEAKCSWNSECPPGQSWWFSFNNTLDAEAFDPDDIMVTPDLPKKRVENYGSTFYIHGHSKARSTYTVTVPGSITDVFGQTLGKDSDHEFKIGSAYPNINGPTGLVVLDPLAKKPTYDIFTTNYDTLKVQLYKVTPDQWPAFAKFMYDSYDYRAKRWRTPPGTKVTDTSIKTGGDKDELIETQIDLSAALNKDGLGHVIAVVEPAPWTQNYQAPRLFAWIQSTRIGLDAFVDNTDMFAWANNLADGKPLADVSLEIEPYNIKGTTDSNGTKTLALAKKHKEGANYLVAKMDGDIAFLPEYSYGDYGSWYRQGTGKAVRWFVFDDRKMYRPGEEVHLKGWLRTQDYAEGGGISGIGKSATKVKYTVFGPRGNEITKGETKVSALGGFDTKFELPGTPNLGYAYINLQTVGRGPLAGASFSHSFQIQEFRRPEFEVSAAASQGPHIVGSHADLTVSAKYYAGGGLGNADTSWYVTTAPGSFTPPNRSEFTFGTWVPWWHYYDYSGRGWGQSNQSTYSEHQGKTDAAGNHVLRVDFLSVNPPKPMTVYANATVMDVNRQAWSTSTSVLVHPSAYYVGLKTEKLFVEKGDPLDINAILVDHEGKAVANRDIHMRAVRLDWTYKSGRYETIEEDPQSCKLTSAKDAQLCTFDTAEGGQYQITATITDKKGRANQTQITVWVSGGKVPQARNVELEQVNLIPDAKEYKPGDTAKIMVQAPFYPAQGMLSIRRSGIVSTEPFTITGPSHTLSIPIKDAYTPNLGVQVDLVGSTARLDDKGDPAPDLPKRPAFAKGAIDLQVPPKHRTLAVTVKPRDKKVAPGGKTKLDISVKDAMGMPVVGAELAVVVVDESVLALTGYVMPDPVATFYEHRYPGGRDHHLRYNVRLARPDGDQFAQQPGDVAESESSMDDDGFGAMGGADSAAPPSPAATKSPKKADKSKSSGRSAGNKNSGPAQADPAIAVRSNFNALAVFSPEEKTGKNGKVTVKVKVPDNLTRYRIMVVAVHGEKYFGKGESSITARMPLMVRPSPPRFLNFGDKFELPIVVQNQTDEAMTVQVAVRSTNALVSDGHGRELTVAANDRVEVRFPAEAEMAGTARFQVAASSGAYADAAEFSLPVWTPATTEAVAVYGEIDKGAIRQPVSLPEAVVTQYGGLEVTTSSTQLQALTDAFLYLVAYPYECAEQISSRVLAVAALRDVLTEFKAEGLPPVDEIEAAVARDIEKLKGLQNWDGGFGFWYRGQQSWPWISIHVANALSRAKAKGFEVPQSMLDASLGYLQNVEQYIPHYYGDDVRRTIIAYALNTRKLMGDKDLTRAKSLITEAGGVKKLSMEAVGWLLGVMAGEKTTKAERKKIHRHLLNQLTETAAGAHYTTSYSDGAHLILHSNRRVDGVILESLIEDKPKSDIIPKIVRGLLAHRVKGRWGNTQENSFVLLALDRYFNEFEKVTPDFVARAWLGDSYAGDHEFKGRTTERHSIDIPMEYIAKTGDADLVLQKDGKGRMYYRIGMTYAPASLDLKPADHGFAVERVYEPVDDESDVKRMKNGTWKIKAGARVRIRLTMVAQSRRYHVALVDPMPAGLEAMNPALAVTGDIPQDTKANATGQNRYWWWWSTWYEHQNMRDERVEAFTSLLYGGVYEYTYVARATTPGTFVVPPTKAEEMYFPETFGRSASDKVIVE